MSALVVGRFTPEQSESIRMALSRAGMDRRVAADIASAKRELSRQPPPLAFVDAAMIDLATLMTWVRGQADLFGTLVIAIVPSPNDGAFREAVGAGCDDVVVLGDLGGVTRRAALLSHYDPSTRPPLNQGAAIVAHPKDHERRMIGRTLRLAGFNVCFAKRGEEVAAFDGVEPPELLVVAESLPPAGAIRAVIDLRQRLGGTAVPSVVTGTDGELRELGGADEFNRMATLSETAPPDHLLFVTNELMRPGIRNLRASRRVLWDALCAFRPAGQLHPVLGLTYNLSADGLYVRSLDPPPRGSQIWFEMRPPHGRDGVHLRGEVVWVKPMGTGPGGSSPPGFGIRIDEQACPPADLERYRACYGALIEAPRMVA